MLTLFFWINQRIREQEIHFIWSNSKYISSMFGKEWLYPKKRKTETKAKEEKTYKKKAKK